MARQEPSADAYESFSMDNDFEGGQWINGEFYYEKRRQKNKMTKEDHLYGVFNEGFEEEGDASRRAKRGGSGAATLKPMSFVSSGTAVPSATIEQEEEEEEEEAEPVERDPFAASGGGRGGLGYRGGNEEEDEDEEEQHRGLGSFASSATKAGAARQAQQAFVSSSASSSSSTREEEREEEEEVYRPFGSAYDALPSSFGASSKGRRSRRATAQREASPPKQQPTPRASASMPKAPKADFEKYSKGVGSRLLAMMGWTGGGLETSTGKGIAAPIEVRLRQGRSGISDDDFRWQQQQQQRYGFDDEEAEAEREEREEEQREPAWRRKGKESEGGARQIKTRMPTKVRKKKMYKTAEEVLMEKERGQRPQKQVIIDMTQAQPRLITDLSQQRDREDDRGAEAVRTGKGTKEGMPAPELGYNMTFLLDLKEIELQGLNNKLRQERTRCERLEQERAALKERVERERAEADRLDSLLNLILKCEEKVTQQQQQPPHDVKPEENNMKLSLKTMSKLFDLIRHKYEREYWQYELAYLVIEMAFPLMREKLKDWRPLKEPALPLDIVLTWKKILLKEEEEDVQLHDTEQQQRTKGRRGRRGRGTEESGAAVYRQLLMDVILPPIRKALINEWNPREEESSQACIQLIRLWQSLLTPSILHHHLLQQLILPKLAREVEEKWNPKEDALPIHRWVLPWLPFFHQQQHQLFSQRLFPTIRQRLSSLLQREWHPSDASAHAMLSPWKEAFGASAMETLLLRCVLPKLTESLRALVINPAGQRRLERFLDVVRWHDLLPQPHFVALMESEFFPKWYHVLQSWLQQSLLLASTSSSSVQQREQEEREKSAALADTYDEITRWYLGWKKLFPEEIVAHPRIRIHFNHALEVMNHYATHLMSESSSEPFQPFPSPYPSSSPSSSSSSSFAPSSSSSSSSFTSLQDKVREELQQEERKAKKGMLLQEPTLKEVIARFAEENEVLFMPKPNARTTDGKQVHSFGGVPIVLGKDLMYAPPSEDGREAEEGSDSKTWTPIGFDELLKRAKLGRRR